jgi:hypothetical protein
MTIISGCWRAACTGILETSITCMLQTSLVHYLQLIQFCHFFSFSSFLFFLSFFLSLYFFLLRLLSFTLHFFLPTSNIFWDQWSRGPLYYAALRPHITNKLVTLENWHPECCDSCKYITCTEDCVELTLGQPSDVKRIVCCPDKMGGSL